MTKLPPRNYFPLTVDKVEYDGIVQPLDRLNQGGKVLTGAVGLEIEVLSPVHVGSGAYGLVDGRVVKQLVTRGGVPAIPGSSIKGICRQTHEVLTRSGSPFKEKPPRRPKRRTGGQQGPPEPPARPSCSGAIFGLLGLQGRISFDDAISLAPVELDVVELSVPYSPQNPVGRRFYGPIPEGAEQPPRIAALVISPGAVLATALRLYNLLEDELGSVLLSLGIDRFHLKLGGGKYDHFGWVRCKAVSYRLREAGFHVRAAPWVTNVSEVESFCSKALAAVHLRPAGQAALRQLEQRMQAPAEECGASS